MDTQGIQWGARPKTAALIVFLGVALFTAASPALALEFYVDAATGDDAHSALEAQSPATPWATIAHALDTADTAAGRHTIHVQAGTYAETAGSAFPDVEIRAVGGTVVMQPPGGSPGLDINHGDVLVEGFRIEGGTHGIRADGADGLVIRGCTAVGVAFNGFHVANTTGVTIENSKAVSSGNRGILLDHTNLAYVRNNLVYDNGDWGVDVENTNPSNPQPPLSTGNLIAFNTVAFNGSGGIRLKNAIGEIRDDIITNNSGIGLRIDTSGAVVQNVLLSANTTPLDPASYSLGGGMLATAPMYVNPSGPDGILGGIANNADDLFALEPASNAVNAGSGDVGTRDIDGSTRQDLAPDSGHADLGFHVGASASAGAPAVPTGPATYYVDTTIGSDARDRIEAQAPGTPWATIGHALGSGLIGGETVVVGAGTYAESLTIPIDGLTVITTAGATLEVPFDGVGVTIAHANTTVDGFTIDAVTNGATHGIQIWGANGTTIQDVIVDTPAELGVDVATSSGVTLTNVTVTSPGTRGVQLASSSAATIGSLVVTGGQIALHATSSDGLAVDGLNVSNQTDDAIVVSGAIGTTIGNATITSPTGIAVDIGTTSNLLMDTVTVTGPVTRGVQLANCPNATVRGLDITGGVHAVYATSGNDLAVEGGTFSSQTSDAVVVADSSGISLDTNTVDDAGSHGFYLQRVDTVYARNNLITNSDDWGLHLDADGAAASTGNVVAFNTLSGNGTDEVNSGAVRFENASGEIRDNIVVSSGNEIGIKTDTAGSTVHHNDVVANATKAYQSAGGKEPIFWANLAVDPVFVGGADYRLTAGSPAIDAGSGAVSAVDISGSATQSGVADSSTADMGFHPDASPSTGAPAPVGALPGAGAVHYVDCATGVDSPRTSLEAQNLATPWKTIRYAAFQVGFGEVIEVAAGTCNETNEIEISTGGVVVRAATPLGTIVIPPAGTHGFSIEASQVTVEGFVIETDKRGVRVDPGGGADLTDVTVRGLQIGPPGGGSIAGNAIHVTDTVRAIVENSITAGGDRGILLRRTQDSYVRNNRVSGAADWGIQVDDQGGVGDATGNVVAFNTVAASGDAGGEGGIFIATTPADVRDNIVASNHSVGIKTDAATAVQVHHNSVHGQSSPFLDVTAASYRWANNTADDPLFVGLSDLRLTTPSPAIDAGSGTVASVDISGSATESGTADSGVADLGFHVGASTSTGVPPIQDLPGGAGPYTYYVDADTGDDTRSKFDARDPATPWATIAKALSSGAVAGDTIDVVGGGSLYPESITTSTAGVTLLTTTGATLQVPFDKVGITIDHANTTVDGFTIDTATYGGRHGVEVSAVPGATVRNVAVSTPSNTGLTATGAADLVVDSFTVNGPGGIGIELDTCSHPTVLNSTVTGGTHGIRATETDGITVRDAQLSGQSANGLMVDETTGVTLENSRINGAGQRGVLLKDTDQAYVRNNGVANSGEWGIEFNAAGLVASPGNVVAFNTVYGSGAIQNAGGIRFQNASGEIRDNILSMNANIAIKVDTAPTYIHHNFLHDSTTGIDDETGQEPVVWANDTVNDPLLVDPANGDLELSSGPASLAFDSGSADIAEADISGSTRVDLAPDTGIADPGFHSGASASTGIPTVMTGPTRPPRTYYVDQVTGSDFNSASDAQTPGGAWETIGKAIDESIDGDTLHIQAGTYAEQISIDLNDFTLQGLGAFGSVVLTPPEGEVGIAVEDQTSVRIENIVVEGGSQGIRAENVDGLRILGCATANQSTLGIHLVDTRDAWVDSCIVTGAGVHGMSLETSSGLYVRNNLVYANTQWGISVDNRGGAPALNNVVAFNTVHQNGDGIRLLECGGEVRDNQITSQVDLGLFLGGAFLLAHHNNFANNARDKDRIASLAPLIYVWSTLGKNPRYVDPAGPDGLLGGAHWADDDFRLQTLAAGEDYDSPSIDAGSDVVGNLDIGGTTATAGGPDTSTADVGYHYSAPAGVSVPSAQSPPAQLARTFFVSPVNGDDTRTEDDAQDPTTPWLTLAMALQSASPGDTVVAQPGVYPEAASVERADLTLVSETPGGAVIQPLWGAALTVGAAGVTVDGFVLRGGSTGLSVTAGADDVRVTNCVATESSTDGFRATEVSGFLLENSIATGSTFSGISLRRVHAATVRNNLAYANGEWGLSHDNSPETEVLSTDNLIAHNTLTMNGLGNGRLLNAVGEVRDNLFSETAGTGLRIDTAGAVLRYNGFNGNGTPLDPEGYLFCTGCTANKTVVPDYVDPTGRDGILGGADWSDDDFRLPQIAAGQASESDAVDSGSDQASTLAVNGSTATTGSIDDGIVDLGYHYDSSSSALPSPSYTNAPTDVFYVDPITGDDVRTRSQANQSGTPWQTLAHALGQLVPGDTVLLAPGIYPESVRVDVENITIRGDGARPEDTILEPSGPIGSLTRAGRREGIRVRAVDVSIENLWIRGARRGIATQGAADRLSIEDLVVTSSSSDGIRIAGGDGSSLSGVIVTGSRRYGVYVRKATGFQMRDCDLYANGRGLGVIRSGGTATFLTVYGNGDGVRSARNTMIFRNSIIAGNERYGMRARSSDAITLDYTLFGLNGRGDVTPTALGSGTGVLLDTDPELADPDGADDVLGGENWQDDQLFLTGPGIDAGSDLASNLGVTGSATGGPPDTHNADLGAHR